MVSAMVRLMAANGAPPEAFARFGIPRPRRRRPGQSEALSAAADGLKNNAD